MKTIVTMFLTLLSAFISAVLNMIWCKNNSFNIPHVPMDMNANFIDGKRIFGNNKTWKGLFGYIIINIILSIIIGIIYNICNLNDYNYFYINNRNTIVINLIIGLLLGLAYALFELPNSFLKRRLNIASGETPKGGLKVLFTVLDLTDSMFGCVLVVSMFYSLSLGTFLLYILFGGVIHIIINAILYILKLRDNII